MFLKIKNNFHTLIFAITLILSAFLVFSVQPMLAKALLPLLGGAPNVWNVCILFYQTLLFLGYVYAHVISVKLEQKKQYILHFCIFLIAVLFLPIGIDKDTTPPLTQNPSFWVLSSLFFAVGIQYFAVSSTAPLLQRWFSNTKNKDAKDPYFLYSASNIGSVGALLAYPFFIEVNYNIYQQFFYWSFLFFVLFIFIFICAYKAFKNQKEETTQEKEEEKQDISLKTKALWFLLAFLPSSLMLGVTTYVTTDIASVPFLWVVPLLLYLLSFIIAFSKKLSKNKRLWENIQLALCFPFIISLGVSNSSTILLVVIHLLFFFLSALVCHQRLFNNRPDVSNLTSFYLVMALGGACGGLFNSLIAPVIFNVPLEYPIIGIIIIAIRSGRFLKNSDKTNIFRDFSIAIISFSLLASLFSYLKENDIFSYDIGVYILSILVGLGVVFYKRPVRFAMYMTSILLVLMMISMKIGIGGFDKFVLKNHRNFFGSTSVQRTKDRKGNVANILFHGSTVHGAQYISPKLQKLPLTYYHYNGPLDDIFKAYWDKNKNWKVVLFGLGTGASSCYRRKGQTFDYYEIDPYIIKLAKSNKYFNYLSVCNHKGEFFAGDARVSLRKNNKKYDLFVLDAFSSDSIPVHLLTKQAVDLYEKHLNKNGLLAFHVSNRFFDLESVLAKIARKKGWYSYVKFLEPKTKLLYYSSNWVVLTKNKLDILALEKYGYKKAKNKKNIALWTDSFSNVFDALKTKDIIWEKLKKTFKRLL